MYFASSRMSAIILNTTVIVHNLITNNSGSLAFCYLEICLSFPRPEYINSFLWAVNLASGDVVFNNRRYTVWITRLIQMQTDV